MTYLLPLLMLAPGLNGPPPAPAEVRPPSRGPALLHSLREAEGVALAWRLEAYTGLLNRLSFLRSYAAGKALPPFPTEEETWEEATRLMEKAMLREGCEPWRVSRVLEALRYAPPRGRFLWRRGWKGAASGGGEDPGPPGAGAGPGRALVAGGQRCPRLLQGRGPSLLAAALEEARATIFPRSQTPQRFARMAFNQGWQRGPDSQVRRLG